MGYAYVIWNKGEFPGLYDLKAKLEKGEDVIEDWKFHETAIKKGDRVFVYKSKKDNEQCGFIASGFAYSDRYKKEQDAYVDIKFDSFSDFDNGKMLKYDEIERILGNSWLRQSSGTMIAEDKKYDIERAWAEVIGVNNDLYNLLKVSPEINPDEHDGSYELVREAIASYSKLDDLGLRSLTFDDIDLIYRFSVITRNKDTYLKAIDKTTIDETEKNRLIEVVNNVWSKAERKEYSNGEEGTVSVGMFGDSLHTFNKPQKGYDTDIPFKLISAFKYIRDHNAQENYTYLKTNLNSNIKGVNYGSFSTMAHCLKPNDFPILNSNQGFGNIFKDLGINIIETGILSDYANNCENIAEYARANNFPFRNYRVFDLISRMINRRNINFDLIKQLLVNHKGENYSKKNETQKDKDLKLLGTNAKKEFDKFAKYINEDLQLYKGSCSGWINQGQKVPDYIWVEFKDNDKVKYTNRQDNKGKQKEIPFSVALSVNRDANDELYYSLRVEYRDSGTESDEKTIFNKNILYKLDDNRKIYYEIYKKDDYRKVNSREEALRIFDAEKDAIKKIRSVFLLSKPYTSDRTDELVNEAKEGLELLLEPYRSIFKDISTSANISLLTNNETNGVVNKMGKTIRSLNTILCGPPGTGKTYYTRYYAVAICDEDCNGSIEEAKKKYSDYDKLTEKYNKLIKENRISFTTFHQSYGYEEFIEGIKPLLKDDDTKDVYYDVVPGVFKKFCDDNRKQIKNLESLGIDANTPIWKMSLYGGKTDILKECFDENYIRIGFEKNSNDKSMEIFRDEMHAGDLVLSLESFYEINGIAIIENDEIEELDKSEFKCARKVKWLFKDKIINIKDINGGYRLAIKTCSGLPNLNRAELYELINKEIGNANIKNAKPCVFIIDEINRGNISKIFGELITLIEPSKRDGAKEAMSCILPYSHQKFSVPNNVYILGTMNTADRSIALMDTALRRRFDFVEMMPNYEVDFLDGLTVDGIDIKLMLEKMNQRIEVLYDREHTLGHAFFKTLSDNKKIEVLASIFETKIIPLLQEYFYEDYEKIQLVLGDNDSSISDDIRFIVSKKVESSIFKGSVNVDDLPEKNYSINIKAFNNPESYKKIY